MGKVEVVLIDNLEQLKREVQEAGVRSLAQYNDEMAKNHPQWPSAPYLKFKDTGWVSWPDLFGIERVELIDDLEELKREVRAAGITTSIMYSEEQKNHPRWPSLPSQKFKGNGWVSWPDLFGKEEVELINDFEELKREVQEAGVRSLAQYKKEQKNHPRWPSHPYQKFKDKGWINWFDFLGKVEIVLIDNLEQLKSEVRAAGIRSKDQYYKEIENYPHWPHNPYSYFKGHGWISWLDLFGKNK